VDEDGVSVSAPLAHQGRAGVQRDTGIDGQSAFLCSSGQALQAASQRGTRAAIGALLQFIGKGSDQQIAAEAERRASAMQLAPGKPQLLGRSIEQAGNFGFDIAQARLSSVVVPLAASAENGRRRATVLASRRIMDCWLHGLAGSAMR